MTGTTDGLGNSTVAAMQCSGASPCPGITIKDVSLTNAENGNVSAAYLCENVINQEGFACTGNVTAASQAFVG